MAFKLCTGAHCDQARLEKLGIDTMVVLVGPESNTKEYVLHTDLVKQHSDFFKAKLQRNSDAQTDSMRLSTFSADDFEYFVLFIYTGHIFTKGCGEEVYLLLRLWSLGLALESCTSRDAVVDTFMQKRSAEEKHVTTTTVERATEALKANSGLAKYFVDIAVTFWQDDFLEKRYDTDELLLFKQNVQITLHKLRRGHLKEYEVVVRCRRKSDCFYHDHKSRICHKAMWSNRMDDVWRKNSEKPQLDTLMGNIFHVKVGTNTVEEFAVRKDLATRHTPMLAKTIDPTRPWIEIQQNLVLLPDVDPVVFKVFVTFLNTGHIHLCHFDRARRLKPKNDSDEDWEEDVAQLWVLGDRLFSTSFKDAIVDKLTLMVSKENKVPKTMHRTIYINSIRDSGMRKLLVDAAVYLWFYQNLGDSPITPDCAEFFKHVAMEIKKSSLGELPKIAAYDRPGCHYHDHGTEPCYLKMFS